MLRNVLGRLWGNPNQNNNVLIRILSSNKIFQISFGVAKCLGWEYSSQYTEYGYLRNVHPSSQTEALELHRNWHTTNKLLNYVSQSFCLPADLASVVHWMKKSISKQRGIHGMREQRLLPGHVLLVTGWRYQLAVH